MHGEHEDKAESPVKLEKVPAGQRVGVEVPEGQYDPAGQTYGLATVDDPLQKYPGEQTPLGAESPLDAQNVPRGQGMQLDTLPNRDKLLYDPIGQGRGETVPTGQ